MRSSKDRTSIRGSGRWMEYLLVERDLKEAIMHDTMPMGVTEADWDKKNKKAMTLIGLNLANSVLSYVIKAKKAKERWDKMG